MEIVQSFFNLIFTILYCIGIIAYAILEFGLDLISIAYRNSDTIIIGFIPTMVSFYFAKKKKNHSYASKSDDSK